MQLMCLSAQGWNACTQTRMPELGIIERLSDPYFLNAGSMTHIIAISGSLRAASYNTALLRAAQSYAPAGVTVEVVTLHDIPFFNEDVEAKDGWPASVRALRDKIQAADALLISTPEYNSGIPGVLKNAFDWISRSNAENPSVLFGKPTALMGATPGGFGTAVAQGSCLPMLRALGVNLWAGQRMMVANANTLFTDGELSNADYQAQMQSFMQGLVQFVQAQAK